MGSLTVEEMISLGQSAVGLVSGIRDMLEKAKATASANNQAAIDSLLAQLNGQREAAVASADAALDAAAQR